MAEISFVLRAITSLLSSLKKADPEKGECGRMAVWYALLSMLIGMVVTSEAEGRASLSSTSGNFSH